MNTAPDQKQSGGTTPPNNPNQQNSGSGTEEIQVSQPHTERAEGPFEHSGETSGWTEAERKEKQEQDQEQP